MGEPAGERASRRRRRSRIGCNAHQPARQRLARVSDGISRLESSRAGVAVEQLADQVALDEFALFAGGLAERQRGKPVDLALGAAARLVNQRYGLAREQPAFAASKLEPIPQLLFGVIGCEASARMATS